MHSLTIVFGPAATAWTLLFKTEQKAESVYSDYTQSKALRAEGPFVAADDFGQTIALMMPVIHGMMLEDMDLSQKAQIERGLHQARSQAEAQKRAMDDPVIKESIRRQQMGPAVFQPGMNGGRPMM